MSSDKGVAVYTYTYENKWAKRRKRLRFWAVILFAGVSLLFFGSFVFWRLSPGSYWKTLVMDKTVPHPDYREHRALFWALNHLKVAKKEGQRRWHSDKDYLGFYPDKFITSDAAYSSNLEHNHASGVDLLFVVDTYGVYADDYEFPDDYRTHLDYSEKIYGGLEEKEVDIIEDFVQKGGSLVAEFNTFNYPTLGKERERLEKLLGLRSTGWIGRYFADLANKSDVPVWAFRNWEANYGKEWDFSGPGFIIVHPDTRLLVLEEGEDVESRGLWIEIMAPDDPLMKICVSKISYQYWFDIVSPEERTEVLAEYRFVLTPEGEQKMGEFSLPKAFPAVLRASRSPLCLYFAGDFSDSPFNPGPHFLYGWPQFCRILSTLGKNGAQSRFFWSFYLPLLKSLFNMNN